MTLFEVGVVIAIAMILVIVLLPRLAIPNGRYSKINCVNNLKQVGVAYRIWEGDNGDIYPMGISVTNGGSMEMVRTGNVLQTFLVMSNELSTPKILYCPEDTNRSWPTSFSSLSNSNISYFISVDVTNELNPQMILSGDCNFEIGGKQVKPGLLSVWTNNPVSWAVTRHKGNGSLGLADGSVQSATSPGLCVYLEQTGLATNCFAIP
jgi:hypothetical protein